MEIYILRHGIAEEGKPGGRDADRALTAEGATKLKAVLKRARGIDVEPTIILTSPLLRARQSAEIAAEALKVKAAMVETRALAPESSPEAVWDEIRAVQAESQILLAGHQPLLSALYAYLLGAPAVQIDVKKGSLGRVDVNRFGGPPRGALRWLIHPKLTGE